MILADLSALWLTVQLALVTTVLLFLLGTPLAWWLSQTRSALKPFVETIVALPLVLPPTVLGFYLLILFNPNAPIGGFWVQLTGDTLTFSFTGLVVASIVYSLPFMVQPLQTAFEASARQSMELAAMLRASPIDAFFTVAVPASVRGFINAGVLTFAHTLGEFGIVLMVGGNIPGETRVVSIAIYEHVETLRYDQAHGLSLALLALSFIILLLVYRFNRRTSIHVG
ncbi:MAG: molybdate ABC transporter permease subunit [Pseudomonadota bacterium]